MDMSMQDILEMHAKISNDPWAYTRRVRDQQALEIKKCEDEHRRVQNLSWFSKSNANAQMDRFQLMQRKECEMLRDMQLKEAESKVHKNNERLENLMGEYMEKEKNSSLHKDRYSQYLRENDPELRALASKLREAYVGKMHLAQIDEKEKERKSLNKADKPYIEEMERLRNIEREEEKLKFFLEEEKKYNFRKQLERQMKEKEYYKEMKESREEDKRRIEAIIKENIEWMKDEKEKELAKKLKLRDSFREAFKTKEEEIRKEKARLQEEEEKLKQFTAKADYRNESELQMKRLREENLRRIQERLGDLLTQKQRDIEEFEAARQDVAIAQAEMQAFRHEQDEKESKAKAKREYVAELKKHEEFSRQAELAQKLQDEKLDKEIERLNQLKIEEHRQQELKKQEKKDQFINECQANIKERLLDKERCHENEVQLEKSFIQDNEKYKSDVEKERIAMIKEMAPYLYPGCIPRGMLREEDIQYLEDPLKNFLLSKKPYPDLNDM